MTAEAVRRHLHVACTLALLVTVAAGCGSGRHDTIRIGIYGDCYGPFAGLGVTERADSRGRRVVHPARREGERTQAVGRSERDHGSQASVSNWCSTAISTAPAPAVSAELAGWSSSKARTSSSRRTMFPTTASLRSTPRDSRAWRSSPPRSYPAARLGPNVFHVAPDIRQVQAGLGAYAFHTLGWRTADIVEEDDPQGYATSAGFIAEFCSLGGTIVGRQRGSGDRASTGHVSSGRSRAPPTASH